MKKIKTRKLVSSLYYTISGIGVVSQERAALHGVEAGAPPDMLRYDQAFQNWDAFPHVVVIPTYSTGKYGRNRGTATHARWSSFLISIKGLTDMDRAMEIRDSIRAHPEQWVTWQHSRTNYTLVKKTWKEFFSEEVTD